MNTHVHIRSGGPMRGAAFFAEPLYTKSLTWDLSTSNVTQTFLSSFGFGPVTAGGYGIGYLVHVSVLMLFVCRPN
jgi:hypothetical protein